MEPRNEDRSPKRGERRTPNRRTRKRSRSRSLHRSRNPRYSPYPGRSRSRSMSPFRHRLSKERDSNRLYGHGGGRRRSRSYENERKGSGDVKKPEYQGATTDYLKDKSFKIIVVRNVDLKETSSHSTTSNGKRSAPRDRDRDRNRISDDRSDHGRRNIHKRSVSPDERSSPRDRRRHSPRNSASNGHSKDESFDRRFKHDYHKSDRLKRGSEHRPRSQRSYFDDDRRSPSFKRKDQSQNDKYEEDKTFKRNKDTRRSNEHYSKIKEEESGNRDIEDHSENAESCENDEDEQVAVANGDIIPPAIFYPPGGMVPRFPLPPPYRQLIHPRRLPILVPHPRIPLGIPGVPLMRRPPIPFFMPPYPSPRFFAAPIP